MSSAATPTPVASPAAVPVRWPVGRLIAHVVAVSLVQATAMVGVFVLAIVAKKNFHANEWHTLVITASPTILFIFSIFWNDVFGRMRLSRYLGVFWLVACLPMVAIAFATNIWMLLIPHLIASVGGAGYHPAAGELLKRLYPDALRGRVYGVIWGASLVTGALTAYGLGKWLDENPEAFRIYIPVIVGLQAVGVAIFVWLGHASGASSQRELNRTPWSMARAFEPVTHMREVLAADHTFARYEAAYMTYGVGWMICYALVPNLVHDKLNLSYEASTTSTQTAYYLAMIVMLWPAGWLLDKLGAVRSTGVSFALLALYPLGLMLATNADNLFAVSLWYGLAHAGASVGWMLGPVSMAPTPEKVPQYVAIHATLVGVRGKIFQFAGVGLYSLTGSFTWPLVIAAACFAWSAVQMWKLDGRMRKRSCA